MTRPLLALALAAAFGLSWRLLRRAASGRPRGGAVDVAAASAGFIAAMFLLKFIPAVVPPQAFIRNDFLFPIWALWEKGSGWWWFLPAAAGVAGLVAGRRSGLSERLPAPFFLASLAVAACGMWIALSLTWGGWPEGIVRPFGVQDYQSDVARFSSIAEIWRTYVGRQANLSLHGSTHPPGAVTVLTAITSLTGGSLPALCVVVVALGTLTLIPLYVWAKVHLDEAGARAACHGAGIGRERGGRRHLDPERASFPVRVLPRYPLVIAAGLSHPFPRPML